MPNSDLRKQPQSVSATEPDQPSTLGSLHRTLALAILVVFLVLGLAGAKTALPQGDEAGYANPGYNIIYNGFSGVTVFHLPEYLPLSFGRHISGPFAPGYFYLSALWFRIFGFGLLQVRLLSLLFALVALISWWVIARYLLNSPTAALSVMAFVSADYYFLLAISHGRPEMVCIGFGTAAIAAYLALRGRVPVWAFFVSHLLATLSILQHPAGLIYWFCLAALILYQDRRFLSLKVIAVAAAPCLAGIALWGVYILQDLPGFLEQWPAAIKFNANVFDDAGLSKISLIRNVQLEVVHRYLAPFGFLPGVNPVNRLKALVLMAYIASVSGIVLVGRLRRQKGLLALAVFAITAVGYLTFVVPGKFSYYLPHVTQFLAACLGAFLYSIASGPARKWVVPSVLLIVGGIQLGGFLYLVRQNAYGHAYAPVIASIRQQTKPKTLILGAPELWFGVLPERSFVSDPTLGFRNGLEPAQFTFDPLYLSLHQMDLRADPPRYAYVQSLLDNAQCVYRSAQYQLFVASPEVIQMAREKAR